MKMLATLTLVAALSPGLQAGAQTPPGAATPSAGPATSDRAAYLRNVHDSDRDWRQKLQEFNAKARAEGKMVDRAAKVDLNVAWRRTEAASRKLKTASAEEWGAAKSEFERASRDLADTWRRVAS